MLWNYYRFFLHFMISNFMHILVFSSAFCYVQSQRNDREKIRQKLAMGLDEEHFAAGDRLFKKPSLQSRLHSAMNLQMCFVNEASSDVAENASDTEQVDRKNCKGLCPRELSSSLVGVI